MNHGLVEKKQIQERMSGGSVFSFIPTIENIIDFAIEMATTDVASLALLLGGANSNLLNLF